MLFDPDSTLTEIAQTVSFARETAHLPWNVCRTEIYSGTRLEQRLRDEGRLTGDFRTYGYVMKDLRAEMMFRIMRVSFAERAFAVDSLLNSLISLAFGRQVHEALFPGAATTHISASVDQLLIDVHLDCVVEMERIIAFVSHCAVEDTHRIRRFAVDSALRMAESDRHFRSRFHLLWVLLNARGSTLYERYHCA
jgi:hypothetical protein